MSRVVRLWILLIILVVVAIGGVGCMSSKQTISSEQTSYNGHGGTYRNVLVNMDTPDPSMVYYKGYYYMTFTHNGTDIMVMRSRTIDFKRAEQKVVWYPPVGEMYSANIWAPELQFIQGKWYIYFAADDGDNMNHRMYALAAITDDPMGEYEFRNQITDDTNKWAIDGLVMDFEDNLYFVWSGWEGDVNIAQNTYIAPMSDPLTISGARVLISEPDLEWERAGGPPYINEGQAILYHNGSVHMTYSGAGSWTPYYSIGLLSLEPGANPLEASSWKKSQQPLLAWDDEAGVYGPGHNSFVQSPDGSEMFIVYHATTGFNDGWSNRRARAQRIVWGEQDEPQLGKALSLHTSIPVPQGTGVLTMDTMNEIEKGYRIDGISTIIDTKLDSFVPILLHYENPSEQSKTIQLELADQAIELILDPTLNNEKGYAYIKLPLTAGTKEFSIIGDEVQQHITALEFTRFEVESGTAIGINAQITENPFASSGGSFLLPAGKENGILLTNVNVPVAGQYQLDIAVSNASGQEATFIVGTSAGSKEKATISSGDRNQYAIISINVKLKAGSNDISLKEASEKLDFDYIDLLKL